MLRALAWPPAWRSRRPVTTKSNQGDKFVQDLVLILQADLRSVKWTKMDLCLGRNWARFTASFLALVAGASINFRRESSKRGPKSGPQNGLQFGSAAASGRPKLSPKSGLENGPRTSQVGPWPMSSCPRGMLRWFVYLPRKQREAREGVRPLRPVFGGKMDLVLAPRFVVEVL